MATRITISGRITLPRKVREALRLSPGDAVEFTSNGRGEFVIHKAATPGARSRGGERPVHPRVEAQRRRRAAELLALLRGLD
jgi:AbrB family looped-hinge helix DNA binding protein